MPFPDAECIKDNPSRLFLVMIPICPTTPLFGSDPVNSMISPLLAISNETSLPALVKSADVLGTVMEKYLKTYQIKPEQSNPEALLFPPYLYLVPRSDSAKLTSSAARVFLVSM